ncbi:hypothetical protein TNCV_3125341 [Trichonephila clavipes]|nr:hypothetical protein TNCV_3125341 [Trichonephila clavipes]
MANRINLISPDIAKLIEASDSEEEVSDFGDQHRTSAYFRHWTDNQRLKKHSSFSIAKTLELLPRDVKHSEIPNLIRQLALETINCIFQISLQIYTDVNRGDGGISVSSHVGIDGNEKADFLARNAAEEEVILTGYLTFSELSSLTKIELPHLGRTPPSHPWYFGRNPGGSLKLMHRKYQTAPSRPL